MNKPVSFKIQYHFEYTVIIMYLYYYNYTFLTNFDR